MVLVFLTLKSSFHFLSELIPETTENIFTKKDKAAFSHDGFLHVFDKCESNQLLVVSIPPFLFLQKKGRDACFCFH